MNKLIFRKFSQDIVNFFLVASFSITFIVWIIQAVNFLDLISDDGHSLKVYFTYVSLNLPKIFSKTIIFVYFISIFYVINKYNNSNVWFSFDKEGKYNIDPTNKRVTFNFEGMQIINKDDSIKCSNESDFIQEQRLLLNEYKLLLNKIEINK